MHQGFDDEKGMAPALDEAPGHTTAEPSDSTGDGSPDCADVSMSNVCGSYLQCCLDAPTARPKLACRLSPLE